MTDTMRVARQARLYFRNRRFAAASLGLVAVALSACSAPAYKADAPVSPAVRAIAKPDASQLSPSSEPVSENSVFGDYLASLHARAQNDVGDAADYLMQVLGTDPENEAILRAGLLLQLQEGDFDQAIGLAQVLKENGSQDQIATLTLVAEAFHTGDFAAVGALLDGRQSGLGTLVGPLLLAWGEAGKNQPDRAFAVLDGLAGREEFNIFQSYHAALIAAHLGRDDSAQEYFEQTVLSPGGGSLRIVQTFGQFKEDRGHHDEAVKLYRDFLARSRSYPLITAALARAEAKRPPEARLVESAAHGAAEVLYGIGSVLSQDRGDGHLPVIYLRLALLLKTDFPVAQILLAGLLEGQGRLDEAIALYSAISSSSPLYESAQIQAAIGHDRAGNTPRAVATLQGFIRNDPGNRDAVVALADLLRTRERFAEAAELYATAIKLAGAKEPQHWSLYYARGVCLERTGHWEDAEASLLTALELRPEQPLVLNYLGYSWIDQGINFVRAREMVENAARQRPNDGFIVDSLGWVHYRLGNYKQAAETLESAVALRPQDPVINDHLGDAYWRAGRKLEARFQWNRALTFDPDEAAVAAIKRKLDHGPDAVEPVEAAVASGASES